MTAGSAPGLRRFGRVQVEMLECVYQHRLLSTGQLHALYREGVSRSLTQRELAAMERVGWLASVRVPGGLKLWFVTERGADAVESVGNRAESRRKVVVREQAAGPLQQHTLAVNEVGVIFARAARERGDEFGPLSWRNEIAHPIGQLPGGRRGEAVIADAVMSYEQVLPDSTYTHLRFVELDRATMATETLIAKLGRYVDLHEHKGPGANKRTPGPRLWRARYSHFPGVMVVLANASRRRLERRRWLTVARWKKLHAERARDVEVYVCLLEDLTEQGPFAAIFKSAQHEELVNWIGEPPEQRAGAEPEPAEESEPDDAAEEPAMPSEPEALEDPEPYPAPVRDAASAPDFAAARSVGRGTRLGAVVSGAPEHVPSPVAGAGEGARPGALVDAAAAGALLGVPASWVLAQARAQRIPHVRLGRYVRFEPEELRCWWEGRRRGPGLRKPRRSS